MAHASDALAALSTVPDDAGPDAVWQALQGLPLHRPAA